MSHSVTLRTDERCLADDTQILLRLGTDGDVDQTIKASLGHYFSYASVLHDLSLPGSGALTLSVYLLEPGRAPAEFRVGPFQRAYRTTDIGQVRQAGVPLWATDVAVEGTPLPMSSLHFDLVVSTEAQVLPDAYAAAGKVERKELREILRPSFERVLDLFGPPRPFDTVPATGESGNLDGGGAR
ncbi:MAG TPA: hypothetical protein VFN21_07245 [Acidimicrobiales bacterium]|nr:hypothetical protein [Acidimicrobiales bacterium]